MTDTITKQPPKDWCVDDFGKRESLDRVSAQFMVYQGQMHPVAYVFSAEHACLIAAAPDLLAFAEWFAGMCEERAKTLGITPQAYNAKYLVARAAMAKATGAA